MANYVGQSSPRNTYENPKVFGLDARILVLVLVCLLHFRWYTVGPTFLVGFLLWWFEIRLSMGVASSMRWIRSWMAGPHRPARSPSRRMKMVDYQRLGVYWRTYNGKD